MWFLIRSPRLRLRAAGLAAVAAALTQTLVTSRNPPPVTPRVVRAGHVMPGTLAGPKPSPAVAAPGVARQAETPLTAQERVLASGAAGLAAPQAVPSAAPAQAAWEQPWIATQATAPGQQLTYQGQRASIVAYQAAPASHGRFRLPVRSGRGSAARRPSRIRPAP